VTRAIECSIGVSMVKGEGRVMRHREASNRLANLELFSYILPIGEENCQGVLN
jgi:hypothetical protein